MGSVHFADHRPVLHFVYFLNSNRSQKILVMRYDDHRAWVGLKHLRDVFQRFQIKVVRNLVQNQQPRCLSRDPSQAESNTFTA